MIFTLAPRLMDAWRRRLARNSRGQTMIEAAFVLPFFLITVFIFIHMGIWTWQRYQLGEAARSGVTVINQGVAEISAFTANEERLIIPQARVPASIRARVVPTCRRSLNNSVMKRGWDYDCGITQSVAGQSPTQPLREGVDETVRYLRSVGAVASNFRFVRITACYVNTNNVNQRCVSRTFTNGRLGGYSSSGGGTDAPAFVRINITTGDPATLGFVREFGLRDMSQSATAPANRYLPACPVDIRDRSCLRLNGYTP